MTVVAELRWRLFVNSMRGGRGRLELASRIFLGIAFVAGGVGGAVGLGAAAWFLTLEGKIAELRTLLWPIFLFWQLFPLTATAFTQNPDSVSLLRFPLSYQSYFLSRLAYGFLDPATAVSGLWLLGIVFGVGAARPSLLPWTAIVLFTFAVVNFLLARMAFEWVGRWLAQRRTREIVGVLFFLSIVGLQSSRPFDRILRTQVQTRSGASVADNLKRAEATPSSPGCRCDCRNGRRALLDRRVFSSTVGVLWNCFSVAAEFSSPRGISRRKISANRPDAEYRRKKVTLSTPAGSCRVCPCPWRQSSKRSCVISLQRADDVHLGCAFIHAPSLQKLGAQPRPVCPRPRADISARGRVFAALADRSFPYNNLGADGRGVQFLFASPVRFRQIVTGKNLAHAAIFILEVALVWLGTSLLISPALTQGHTGHCRLYFVYSSD